MRVGAGRIVLDFFNNDKASVKHRKLEELCAELRHKFNVSCLEVDDFDDPERCVIGFAAVIPEDWKDLSVDSFIRKICDTIDSTAVARVMVEDTEILILGHE